MDWKSWNENVVRDSTLYLLSVTNRPYREVFKSPKEYGPMRYLILSLIILLGLSSPAISGTRDPKTPDAKHLAYGELHQCVVPVRGTAQLQI